MQIKHKRHINPRKDKDYSHKYMGAYRKCGSKKKLKFGAYIPSYQEKRRGRKGT